MLNIYKKDFMLVSFSCLRQVVNMNIEVFFYSEISWEQVVNNRLPREIGKRNFHPRFNNWSILSLGKVHLVAIGMNKNK